MMYGAIETKKTVLTIFTILCLLSAVFVMALVFNIQVVKASGTIHIRLDGSIDPPTAPIHRDGDLYTLTDNILSDTDGIVVERNNIVIDGNGYTLQGTGAFESKGIDLSGREEVTVRNTQIKNFYFGISACRHAYACAMHNSVSGNNIANNNYGIRLEDSSNNSLSGNNITANNSYGIEIISSSNNSVSGNNIANNNYGIYLGWASNYNSISENNITANNNYGIWLSRSSNNIIYNNNFIDNNQQVELYYSSSVWDDGYPSGGNYWSDYNGTDLFNGLSQDQLGSDGIGDTPYIINVKNPDRYPLMSPWTPPEHELVMSITAPTIIRLDSSSWLNATVSNEGLNDEVDVELEILINGTTADSTIITLLQAGDSQTLSYLWTPTAEGTYNVTAYAHPVLGETSIENNQMSKFVTVSALAPPPEAQVGVEAGDWIKCDYTVTGWPSATPYPQWLKVEILSVEETAATVQVTMHMSDGTEQSDTVSVDVVAGGETFDTLFGFVIQPNCTTGDSIIMGGDGFTFNVTIDGETTRTYAGASRTVVYASFSQYGAQLTYYWDKQTGIMMEASTTSGGITGTAKATETNMWETVPSPFWMQWWLWAITAVGIVALAGTVYFLKKRKPPITPIPSPEKTDQSR